MGLKQDITSKFKKDNFKLLNCGTAEDGDWNGVDDYIRQFIKDLNRCENISTLYSCEGHYENDSAYIFFNVNESGWDIFWQEIMPDLSNRFCMIHPEMPDMLYQIEWLVSTKHNKYNSGISIHTNLTEFKVDETSRVITTWNQKKEIFWSNITEVFLKYYK